MSAARTLDAPLTAYRIGDPHGLYKVFSGEGAARVEGRWHARGQEVVYCAEHYSTALLEKLVYFNNVLPPRQHFVEITIPVGTSYEVVTKDTLPDWCLAGSTSARSFGATWLEERRSCLLIVPSFVARMERNVLVNPHHPDFKGISCGLETPVWWDGRLFT